MFVRERGIRATRAVGAPQPSMKIVAGCSSRFFSDWIIVAASNPSTNR